MGTNLSEAELQAAIQAKRARLPAADTDERFQLYCEIGDIYCDELGKLEPSRTGAISAYREAHILKPLSLGNRHFRLLDLVSSSGQWGLMIEIFLREAGVEKDRRRKGICYYTAGVVYRDALKFSDDAIEQFNLALDAYFESPERTPEQDVSQCFKPLVAIEKICITRKDWKAQAHNYHRMIERLPRSGQELVTAGLWHALANLYRYRLGDLQSATYALDLSVQLEPDHRKRSEILTKLGIHGEMTASIV